MDDTKKEGKATSKKSGASAATAGKKKRATSRPPQESKATKKKKKDVDSASLPAAPPAAAAVVAATATAASKKRKKAAPPVGVAGTVPTSSIPSTSTANNTGIGITTNAAAGPISGAVGSPTTPIDIDWKTKPLVDQVLFRLTEGIPRMELRTMVTEADECEKDLLREIQLLEASLESLQVEKAGVPAEPQAPGVEPPTASDEKKDTAPTKKKAKQEKGNTKAGKEKGASLKKGEKSTTDEIGGQGNIKSGAQNLGMSQEELNKQVDTMLESPLTPLDRHFTLSALMGRLRDDLALPSIRKPSPAVVAAASAAGNKKKKANSNPAPTYPQLMAMVDSPNYTMVHPDPPAQLLQVWRKIASHRTSTVFRKPVKPEEAPGYAERILFPMDLSLIRKMIVARILTSYSEVHQKIRLISHNCVKYNGRESDYGIVAREFEAVVDELMYNAVQQPVQQGTLPVVKGAVSGRSSPKNVGGIGSGRVSPKPVGSGSGRISPKPVGRPPSNKKMAQATTTNTTAASLAAASAAAAAAVAAKPASAPASAKAAGKKSK